MTKRTNPNSQPIAISARMQKISRGEAFVAWRDHAENH